MEAETILLKIKKMKNKIIFTLYTLVVSLLCSCVHDSGAKSHEPPDGMVSVVLPFCNSPLDVVTRSVDENRITDVNLYIVSEQRVVQHVYSTSATAQFRCPVGNYQFYVIANHHADMGVKDYQQITGYIIIRRENYEDLPMVAMREVEVVQTADVLTLPTIELERRVAKINYEILIDEAVREIEIKSVQVFNMPNYTSFSGTSSVPDYPQNFTDGAVVANEGSPDRMVGSIFMLPNLQGVVPSIKTQAQKNSANAPSRATYLRIRALRGGKVLDYSVYLGENDTSDFNVRPNTAHTLSITIRNDSTTDVRVRSYTIQTQSVCHAPSESGIYLDGGPLTLSVMLGGQTRNMNLRCEMIVTAGNCQFFTFQGIPEQQTYDVPLDNLAGTNEYTMEYYLPTFAPENVWLKYTLNFYDRYGFVTSVDFSFCFARVVKVYTLWFKGGRGYGSVSSPDALHSVLTGTLSSEYYLFFCSDAGCTLVATPDQERSFIGWYAGHDITGTISNARTIHCLPPTAPDEAIYAYFL